MDVLLYETQPAQTVNIGDVVYGMPHLNSCCLILVATASGMTAQHWPGTDPGTLDPALFSAAPTEIMMVTGSETPYLLLQAQTLQQQYPAAAFSYFAYNNAAQYPMPVVDITAAGFQLQGPRFYRRVI